MKKHYVIKNAIERNLCDFLHNYLLEKREVLKILTEAKYISPFSDLHGKLDGDPQIPDSFCIYGDVALDSVLLIVLPIIEKKLKLKLVPTYSYARIYKKGDELKRHTDRASCAVSGTMNLGGELWPIYLKDSNKKLHKVKLSPGDMLIYDGVYFEHWREKFKKNMCTQVFLHFNKKGSKNIYDTRKRLGLPTDFKTK
jgi:hypothetical protein